MSDDVFDPVPSPFNFSEAEKETIRFWKEHGTYHASLRQREGAKPFVFYEGPPTANGMPHPGHCLTRTIKDIFPRYKTMDGYYCERKAGWDTHGLPVEIEVCKELGIMDGGKEAIEAYGVAEFNRKCVESVFRYQREWEEMTGRIGFWVDLDQAYVTYHQSYVESVWWALTQLFNRGLLYQGHKVVWWWAQGGTALSAGEVGEGYRDTDDPAITVRLTLTDDSAAKLELTDAPASLLIWTTTPWTLSSNCAACVGAEIEYAVVKNDGGNGVEYLVLAEALVEKYFGEDAEIVRTLPGTELLGLSYTPIFDYGTPEIIGTAHKSGKHWIVIPGDFVNLETGTGIVHIAPAFGEDDYQVCKDESVGFLCFVKTDGTFDERVTDVDPHGGAPIAGQFCKDADKGITRILKERGAILKHEQYRHSYPYCPRAEDDPLIQYARKSWFIRTSDFVGDFLANNKEIHWQPGHIRDGRFGKFLESNVDWALSRERYWGTPLPIWVCEETGHMEALCSYAELMAKPGVSGAEVWEEAKAANPELSDHLRIHKPYIDAITFDSPKADGARMRRVTEVIDCWFDAGCMPFAQWGYPHAEGSKETFENRLPADFISEALDQTRGWFYALLAISTLVFGKDKAAWPHPFRNCICLGLLLGEDGRKLSKRLKNYAAPELLFDEFSADALRWSFISKNAPTSSSRMSKRTVEEAQRELLIRWYNVYSFFIIYAKLDGFHPANAPAALLREVAADPDAAAPAPGEGPAPYAPVSERSELDRWILHSLSQCVANVRAALDGFETYPAARSITAFVDSLSNWYVRRSRARFWARGWTQDKADAYWTLYECLLKLARLAAPFTPFFSEHTWRNLCKPLPGAADSVHLSRYPTVDAGALDQTLLEEMAITREAVKLGLSARRAANLKVRQPLGQCQLVLSNPADEAGLRRHIALLKEELNIKAIEFTDAPEKYVSYEVRPNFKVLGPRFGKQVQTIRKALAAGDGAAFFAQLQRGAIEIEVDGECVSLSGGEVEVRLTAKDGFAAAQGPHMVVVLSTEVTGELRREGWVREYVRHIQDQRKELGLAYDARIDVLVRSASEEHRAALGDFESYIAQEVLADAIRFEALSENNGKTLSIDGADAHIEVTPH